MADLVEAENNVPCRIKPGDAGALMRIHADAAFIRTGRAECVGESGMDFGTKRRIGARERKWPDGRQESQAMLRQDEAVGGTIDRRNADGTEVPSLLVGETVW